MAAPATPVHALAKQVEILKFGYLSGQTAGLAAPARLPNCAGVFGTLRDQICRSSGLAASTIKIQKFISFSRSPNEHFSLKPCKVILFFCMDLPVASHHVASLV